MTERPAVKRRWIPLALNRIGFIPTANHDEVDLISSLIPPVPDGRIRLMGLEIFENQVLPQAPVIFWPQRVPAADKADKAGVEPIDPWLFDDLVLSTSVEWTHNGDRMGQFQRLEVTLDRRTRNAQRGGRSGHLVQPPALPEEILQEGIEAIDVAESVESLDVTREEGVEPLPVEADPFGTSQQGRRQPAQVEPLRQGRAKSGQLIPEDGRQMDRTLPTRQRILELPACCQRRGSGRQ